MNDFDERILECRIKQRIRQENRWWIARHFFKAVVFIVIAVLYIAYKADGN